MHIFIPMNYYTFEKLQLLYSITGRSKTRCQAARNINIAIRNCASSLHSAGTLLHANRPARIHPYYNRNKNTFPRERWKLSGKRRPAVTAEVQISWKGSESLARGGRGGGFFSPTLSVL